MTKQGPLYISIFEVLKENIINGFYKKDTLLPTESELEEIFKVSKITVRKAIELLEQEGYVSKQSGKGTTVISNSIFNKLSKGESFTNILQKEGFSLRKEKTNVGILKLDPQHDLYKYFGHTCAYVERNYYLDGKPYIHFTHYLPADIQLEPIQNDDNFSLYMQLFKNKQYIKKFHDEFYIDYPNEKVLESLHLSEGPLLGRKRVTYNTNEEVIEVSYASYNTRLHNYVINFHI